MPALPGQGLHLQKGSRKQRRDLERRRGKWKEAGPRDAGGQVTGIPAAPTSTHPMSIYLPGRVESRWVTCPDVLGSWSLSPLLLCEDFMVPCDEWDSTIARIFCVLDSTASAHPIPPVDSPRAFQKMPSLDTSGLRPGF